MTEDQPRGWSEVELGDVAEIKGRIGWRGLKKNEYTREGPILLSIGNITEHGIDFENVDHLTWERYRESPEIIIELGDIIMGKDGTLGKVALVESTPYETTISSTLAKIRVKSSLVSPRFLFYYFKSDNFKQQVIGSKTGSTVPHFVQKNMKMAKVPVPPREIQDGIVAVLDRVSRLKQKREKANQMTNKILQAVFLKMFGDFTTNPDGWPTVKLDDITELVTSGATPTVGNSKLYSDRRDGVPFFRIQNVDENRLILSDLKYITREVNDTLLKRSQIRPSDVLVTITGRLGTAAIVPPEVKIGNINQHICLVRLRNIVDPIYVAAHLNSKTSHAEIMQKQQGATRIALNLETIRSLTIALPPLSIQKRFVSVVERIEDIKEKQEQSTHEITQLFNSLMSKAFKGELVLDVPETTGPQQTSAKPPTLTDYMKT